MKDEECPSVREGYVGSGAHVFNVRSMNNYEGMDLAKDRCRNGSEILTNRTLDLTKSAIKLMDLNEEV